MPCEAMPEKRLQPSRTETGFLACASLQVMSVRRQSIRLTVYTFVTLASALCAQSWLPTYLPEQTGNQ